MVACLGELTMGRSLPLETADCIYSDENNFLPLTLSTSLTWWGGSPCSAAKSNKRQKEEVEEVEGGGDTP